MDKTLVHKLFSDAKKARGLSHSPYSGRKVGAAVLTEDGSIFSGCNIENASFGGTVCAERVAIWKALSEGAREIQAVAVVTAESPPWPPCGLCLQVLAEFMSPKGLVLVLDTRGRGETVLFKTLFPRAFTRKITHKIK